MRAFLFRWLVAALALWAPLSPTYGTNASDLLENLAISGPAFYSASGVSIAALKAAPKPIVDGSYVQVLGYYAAGDGGGGVYRWNATDISADNGGTIIAPTAGGTGRWNLVNYGKVDIKQFGAIGDNATIATTAIQAAVNSGAETIHFSRGTYYVDAPISVPGSAALVGDGRNATVIQAHFKGSNIGLPIFSFAAGERPAVREMFLGGNLTAAGVLATHSYLGLFENGAYAALVNYGIKLDQAASSIVSNNDFLYYRAATDVGVIYRGGSANDNFHNRYDTYGIGIAAATDDMSGGNIFGNSFGENVTGITIPLNQARWSIVGNYFEGTAAHPLVPMNIGMTGAGGNLSIVISNNLIAVANNNAFSIHNCDNLIFTGNTVGPIITFGATILDMLESENWYVGVPVRNAARSVRIVSGTTTITGQYVVANVTGQLKLLVDAGFGGTILKSLDVSGKGYQSQAFDASLFSFRPSGTEVAQLTSAGLRPTKAGSLDLGTASTGFKRLYVDYTNTVTVGAVQINKAAGRVNIAGGGNAVTVTNSLVTAASHVFAQAATNDAICSVKNVVAAAGSFIINTTANCAAQTSFDFFVVNAD